MKTPSEFTNQLFGVLASGEFIEIRTIAGGKARSDFYGSAEEAAKAALSAADSADAYFGVATRDGTGGKKANVVRIPAVWADVDAKDGLGGPIDRIARAPIEPSAIVVSGNGCHAYWFLDVSVDRAEIARIERLNKAIAAVVEGGLDFRRRPGAQSPRHVEPQTDSRYPGDYGPSETGETVFS